MKTVVLVITILMMVLTNVHTQEASVLDIIIQHPDLRAFQTILQETDLLSIMATADNMTIFAPSNTAFESYTHQQNIQLDELLAYHIVPARLPSGQIRDLIGFSSSVQAMTLARHPLILTTRDNHIFADNAQLIQQDINARNGIVHVIDRVLTPTSNPIHGSLRLWSEDEQVEITINEGTINPSPFTFDEPLHGELQIELPDGTILHMTLTTKISRNTLASVIQANQETLSTFWEALEQAGLTDLLNGDQTYTVFAPSNTAFEQFDKPLNPDDLADVLRYHIIPTDLTLDRLASILSQADSLELQMLNRDTIMLSLVDDQLHINDATIVVPDLITNNGIIHIIDQLLLPSGTPSDHRAS